MPAARTSSCECRSQFPDDIQVVAECHIRRQSQGRVPLKHHTRVILQNTHQHDVRIMHGKFLSRRVPVSRHLIHPIQSSVALTPKFHRQSQSLHWYNGQQNGQCVARVMDLPQKHRKHDVESGFPDPVDRHKDHKPGRHHPWPWH